MENQQKRIAFISDHASPLACLGGVDTGGQNVYVAQLAQHLVRKGFLVDVFTRRETTDLPDVVNWIDGVRVIHIDAGPAKIVAKEELLPFMTEFKHNMLKFILAEKLTYSLTHANFFMSALVAMFIKQRLKVPFVVTFHALGYIRRIHQGSNDRFPDERIFIERRAIQEADFVIAECPQDKADLLQFYAAPSKKIAVIPCGFSKDEFQPVNQHHARQVTGLPQNARILLQLGRMVPRKGVDNVIKALGNMKRCDRNTKLVIVGGECTSLTEDECPEYARLMNIVREYGLQDSVIFTGRKNRNELKYYYAAADVFITTPWYEPFGITPLEAMACGTPVIGSDVGGIKYSVVHNETGWLVPPDDPIKLAQEIDRALSDVPLLKQFGANALKRVNTYFTWQGVAQQMSSVYGRVITQLVIDNQLLTANAI